MSEQPPAFVRLISHEDDQPNMSQGSLIPSKHSPHTFTPRGAQATSIAFGARALLGAVAVVALVLLGTTGYGLVAKSNLALVPTVTMVDPELQGASPLGFGPHGALAQPTFFTETRDAFIEEGLTFVEVDMTQEQLHYFKHGVLLQSAEIFAVGEEGSWWDTPSGLYKIEKKDEQAFTNIGQVYLPWRLTFQGNYIIHGLPTYPDESEVASDFSYGGIRLSNQSAEILYKNVSIDTPVLVHAAEAQERDTFVYQPKVQDIKTPHYFIADLENDTILAASDLNSPAPIASLGKLMTAVVAADTIDLDGRIRVTSPTFVTSLIPRLSERSSVSVYSLLQLLLVESSNEAAETLAGEIGRAEFIEAMNAKARQLGMTNTIFADPSGLSPDNVSSLGDLFILTKYIYDERSFIFEITANDALPNSQVGGEFDGLVNFNEIEDIDSFVGGKVGETLAAGQTSISLHKIMFQDEERVLVVILLGSDGRTDDIEALLSYVQEKFGR